MLLLLNAIVIVIVTECIIIDIVIANIYDFTISHIVIVNISIVVYKFQCCFCVIGIAGVRDGVIVNTKIVIVVVITVIVCVIGCCKYD